MKPLKDEASFWMSTMPKIKFKKLSKDIETDVAVIGGGIAGLTAAYLLKKAGKKVAVVEMGTIGDQGGTTINTTGKVTSQHNLTYKDLSERLGEKTARLYGEANQMAIDEIESVIKREKIDCDWERSDSYVYTRIKENIKEYKAEASIAKRLGLPATFETTTPLPFEVAGAVKFSNQAQFHCGKYIASLAQKIDGEGSYIFEKTKATGIHDGNPAKIETEKHTVIARDLIVATNVPTFPLIARGAYCMLEYPQMSYIVSGKPQKKIQGMYISTDKDEYSILPVKNTHENLILIGGQNHIPFTKFNKETRYERLAQYAKERFGVEKVEYTWYARDYTAYDSIPLVGKLYPWSKHLYVITAFRKWGLANSMVSATILRDTIIDTKNKWAEIYNPIRLSPITNIPRVAISYIGG